MKTTLQRWSAILALAALASLVALGSVSGGDSPAGTSAPARAGADTLRPASSFAHIRNARQRSLALFREAGKVMTHPRCANCHPSGDQPGRGRGDQVHRPMILRGKDGFGVVGMRCATCHTEANYGRVPGAPNWHLAPRSMALHQRTLKQICQQFKDPKMNGGRTVAEVVDHVHHDPLLAWSWAPGADREPAPGDHKTFADLISAWADSGAHCPPR
ncbi:MAG: Isoquinoline 1-oxidoreductase subunit [Myxococcota bacterium]